MGFLTNKERRRLDKVTAQLKSGLNPYADLTARRGNPDQGGLDQDREVRSAEVPHKVTFCKEIHRKNIPQPMFNVPPGQVMCSFCGKMFLDDHRITRATTQRRAISQDIVWDSETHRIVEVPPRKLQFTSTKVIACAGCALQVATPNYIIKWPETE